MPPQKPLPNNAVRGNCPSESSLKYMPEHTEHIDILFLVETLVVNIKFCNMRLREYWFSHIGRNSE